MRQPKRLAIRLLIHLALIVWVIYSIMPFVMSIVTSFQITRDATARQPRFVPAFLVENQLTAALILGIIIVVLFLLMRRKEADATTIWHYALLGIALAVVVGGFLLLINSVDESQTFVPTGANYLSLWFSSNTMDFAPIALMALILIAVLAVAGVGAMRLGVAQSSVYLTIAAVIVSFILFLPNLAPFAEFYGFFLNSVIVTVGTVAISISIGCLAGYALARYRGFASVLLLFGALAFRALPRLAFILPYYFFAQLSGLYDTYFLLIITLVAINQPFTIWMLRSFFMEIPNELEEAAMIDGCSRLTAFLRVILPIAWPGIITTSLFTLLLAYNEFLLARLLTSTLWTLPVGISRFTSGEDIRLLPLANASAVSITIPIIFIIIFFQRNLIKGLAGGAIKG
jgi:ABC-type glycerol-3-phosphate transport system permease component